jgi:hypothetical protein
MMALRWEEVPAAQHKVDYVGQVIKSFCANIYGCAILTRKEYLFLILRKNKEISWKQKSRVLLLKKGDKCTKFFHRIANSNR